MSNPPPHEIELRVGGEVFRGWTSGRVRQSLEQLATTFSLDYIDQWVPDAQPWAIEEGDECELLFDGERVTAGYVDEVTSDYGPEGWGLSLTGRSYLGDLVDSSVVRDGKQWLNQGLTQIAVDLLEPFGLVPSFVIDEGEPFRRFKFEPGDTVVDVLKRAAALRGFLLTDIAGELTIARAGGGELVGAIRRSENVIRGQRKGSWRERHSAYHFCGQTQADDEVTGKSASQLQGNVDDPAIKRYRPMVVISGGGQDGNKDLGKRAIVERNNRAGRGERLSYKVAGFRTNESEGELWRPNQLAKVEDDWLRVDATLIVVSVTQRFGPDTEMATQIELTRPEAYDEVGYPARGRGEVWE